MNTNMKKILFAMLSVLALVACNENYNYGIAEPQSSSADTRTVAFGDGNITEVTAIDLADVTTAGVKVCEIVPPSLAKGVTSATYVLITNNKEYSLDADGVLSVEDLNAIILDQFGTDAPEQREIKAMVRVYFDNNGNKMYNDSNEFTIKVTPAGPNIEDEYYMTSPLNKWDNANTDWALSNGGGSGYDNPIFTIRIKAEDIAAAVDANATSFEFKLTPKSGLGDANWSKSICQNKDDATKLIGNNAGDNFVVTLDADAKFYDLTFNMREMTWEYKVGTYGLYIYEAGVNNDWGSKEQALYGDTGDGKYTGFFYAQDADWTEGKGAFKFRGAADNWDNGNWGTGTFDATTLSGTLINGNDAGNIMPEPGFYRADVDIDAMTFTLTAINKIFVVGNSIGDWDNGVEMTFNVEKQCWECDATFLDADDKCIKFKGNGTWDNIDGNWGGTTDEIINGSNTNIAVTLTGEVHIEFYPICDTKSYCVITQK